METIWGWGGHIIFSKLDILKNQFSKVFSKFHVQRLALHLVIVIILTT